MAMELRKKSHMKFHSVVVSYAKKVSKKSFKGLLWGLVVGGYRIFFILFVRSSRGKKNCKYFA